MNNALNDVKQIIETRPELEPHQWEIVEKASPWLKAQLRPDVRAELEEDYLKRYTEDVAALRTENQTQIAKMMQQWKDEQEPLGKEDLQALLSQEYATFTVKLMDRKTKKTREFTLVELPQAVESKFIAIAQRTLIPMIEKMNALDWNLNANWAAALQKTIDSLPDALDVAAELVAVCLNPWDDEPEITKKWVQDNIATHRITKIIIGQSEVNKYRDFFSGDFRLFRTLKQA